MKNWLASVEDDLQMSNGYDSGTKDCINARYRTLMFWVEETMTSNDYTEQERLERIRGLCELVKHNNLSLAKGAAQ